MKQIKKYPNHKPFKQPSRLYWDSYKYGTLNYNKKKCQFILSQKGRKSLAWG